jgi:hypothetical protein
MLIYHQPLLCGLLLPLPLVKYICDRRYFSIVLGIVPQLRYNYKIYRQQVNLSAKITFFRKSASINLIVPADRIKMPEFARKNIYGG